VHVNLIGAEASVTAGHVAGVCFTVLFIGLFVGFVSGWEIHDWFDAKQQASGQAKVVKAVAKENVRRAAVAQNYSQRKQQIEAYYAQNPDWWMAWLTARPAVADCDIGPDGLRDWNLWNKGPGPYDPAKPAGPVPAAPVGGERPAARPVGEPQAGDDPLLRLPEPSRGPGGGGEG
jgi:hypothetical protein